MSILRLTILLVGLILSAFSVTVNDDGPFPIGNVRTLYIGSGIVAF
ncbi:hypothetical protein NJ7G_1826 [Natrinema sp. J7-2]|nr:hypothetical protein NJ7G_1826 [Natrinema sp. J7-2]